MQLLIPWSQQALPWPSGLHSNHTCRQAKCIQTRYKCVQWLALAGTCQDEVSAMASPIQGGASKNENKLKSLPIPTTDTQETSAKRVLRLNPFGSHEILMGNG
ncbi:Uncharacterized protein TCM_041012 [Theobroma cacao]|uniref:Uncharacterized protein n=1 Tax=Theobroma cacao TaxID=3641 RepID=A0A061GU25_THECC|nr:Uncharacterized protein TCM_041012 [Theobroma cacao]